MADPILISSLVPAVVYVNDASGAGAARASVPRIHKVFEAASAPAEFVAVDSARQLYSAARAAIHSGKRLLVALGGDGTLQALVNAAYGADVVLAVLPAGGGNDFAAALQLPANPVAAVEAILRGQPRPVDLVRVRTADGQVRLYLGGGGVGIDAEAARHANGAFRRLPGRSRYIASALRVLCGFRPICVRVEFPGSDLRTVEAQSLLAAVLYTPTYGAGIRLAPEARLDDGWLDAVIVEDQSVFQILALLPRLMMSGELRATRMRRFRVQAVRLIANRPNMFHGDGEILGPAPVEIEVVPHAVRILTPTQHL
ncbi:MAG: diacylglycerol kinase family protein [Candidatus Acidiferrum sp.]